jgi:hypothetical protein
MAQTTITGELRLNYKAVSSDAINGVNNTNANSGFGNEQQINVQTKGKLNVGGLEYAAGFAIENDGVQASTLFNENTYMDITNPGSGTTISIGLDHIQRSDTDRSAAVFFGFTPNDLSSGINKTRFNQNLGPAISQGMGAAVLQKTPIGTFSYNYVPSIATPYASTPTTGSGISESFTQSEQESGYEYGFTGDFGVKGLSTYYFKGKEELEKGATTKAGVLVTFSFTIVVPPKVAVVVTVFFSVWYPIPNPTAKLVFTKYPTVGSTLKFSFLFVCILSGLP